MQSLRIFTEGDKSVIPQSRSIKLRFKNVENGDVRLFINGEEMYCTQRLTDCVEVSFPFDAEKEYRVEVTYAAKTRLGKWLAHAQKVLTEAQGINPNKEYAYRVLLQADTEETYAQMIDALPVDMAAKLRLKEVL